jgi:hypothetical protein
MGPGLEPPCLWGILSMPCLPTIPSPALHIAVLAYLGKWPHGSSKHLFACLFLQTPSGLFAPDRPLHHFDRRSIEHRLDVSGTEFLDHLDARAVVLGALMDVGEAKSEALVRKQKTEGHMRE